MAKIFLNIEAESTEDLKATIADLHGTYTAAVIAEEPEKKPAPKKTTPKRKPTPKKTEEKPAEEPDSTDSTSEEKPSTTGTSGTEKVEKSQTADLHPGATKADVQALMKKAMAGGHRDDMIVAFQRNNATKLSELAEEDYGTFMTDLEAMIEAGEK